MKDVEVQPIVDVLYCPCCETRLEWITRVTGESENPIRKGNIVVCSGCAAVLKVSDSSLAKMSKREIRRLGDTEKSILKVVVLGVLANIASQKGIG